MIRVLLVEDTKMGRDCIAGYIRSSGRYTLAAAITSAGMAEMTCMHTQVDLILMDYRTENNEDGISAAAAIKRHMPHIKIIIITSMTSSDLIDRARAAGADSFWYKEAGDEELLTVMDRTMNGASIYPDTTPVIRIGNAASTEVTPMQLEVLRLMVKGYSNPAIAEALHISVHDVKWHIKELFQKTGYTSRVALVADVINKEFIVPGLN
ncbi:MAG: response regulator [Faecousia sp.]